jgi:hypothetical protein
MRVKARALVATLTLILAGSLAQAAVAQRPVGGNPRSNYPLRTLPQACWNAPTGVTCLQDSVAFLDRARASLGQPSYRLPRNFLSLRAPEQAFVLTNLDRLHYHLAPIPGLTASLNRAAAAGAVAQTDPQPAKGWDAFTANWAGGYPNIVLAYEGWMFDDGPGSDNIDCSRAHRSGCWGHRHDILWRFGRVGALVMGAAARMGARGNSSFAMLLQQERPGIHPAYLYRWSQAVRAGAHG